MLTGTNVLLTTLLEAIIKYTTCYLAIPVYSLGYYPSGWQRKATEHYLHVVVFALWYCEKSTLVVFNLSSKQASKTHMRPWSCSPLNALWAYNLKWSIDQFQENMQNTRPYFQFRTEWTHINVRIHRMRFQLVEYPWVLWVLWISCINLM